jgi:uncharacterized SAM-binding protein YcdF (DUF218 family)
MWYALSKIGWMLLRPSSILLVLCLSGLLLNWWQSRCAWGRRLLLTGVAGLAACAILPIGALLLRPLENRFPPLNPLPRNVDGIIVLGGAIDTVASAAQSWPALNDHADRMTAFGALARAYPRARLVFTGGDASLISGGTTEAQIARKLFAGLGLDLKRIRFEDRSRNTRENALFSQRMVAPRPGERWLLVTSAADMPRAIGCFRAIGWLVTAFPVDYHAQRWTILPGLVTGLREVDWGVHEWMGLVYYRARGWTSFPIEV